MHELRDRVPCALKFALLGLALAGAGCQDAEASAASAPPAAAASETVLASPPERTVESFYDHSKSGDFKTALSLFSKYSAEHFGIDAASEIQSRSRSYFAGERIADYKIADKHELAPDTVAFDVWVKKQANQQPPETSDETLIVRREPEGWRLNFNALVDYRRLDVPPLTRNQVTLQPFMVERFASSTKIHLHASNASKKIIHWGWAGDRTTARVGFADGSERTLKGRDLQLQPGEKSDLWIKIDGYAEQYPSNFQVENWCLGLGGLIAGQLPDENACWQLTFDLKPQ
jgi:hypothetical protein